MDDLLLDHRHLHLHDLLYVLLDELILRDGLRHMDGLLLDHRQLHLHGLLDVLLDDALLGLIDLCSNKLSIILYRGNQTNTMPKNKTVEINIYKVDIQTYIIISGVQVTYLSTKKVIMVKLICFKYLVKRNLSLCLN